MFHCSPAEAPTFRNANLPLERKLTSSIRASAPLGDYSNNDNHWTLGESDDFPETTHAMNAVEQYQPLQTYFDSAVPPEVQAEVLAVTLGKHYENKRFDN